MKGWELWSIVIQDFLTERRDFHSIRKYYPSPAYDRNPVTRLDTRRCPECRSPHEDERTSLRCAVRQQRPEILYVKSRDDQAGMIRFLSPDERILVRDWEESNQEYWASLRTRRGASGWKARGVIASLECPEWTPKSVIEQVKRVHVDWTMPMPAKHGQAAETHRWLANDLRADYLEKMNQVSESYLKRAVEEPEIAVFPQYRFQPIE